MMSMSWSRFILSFCGICMYPYTVQVWLNISVLFFKIILQKSKLPLLTIVELSFESSCMLITSKTEA